ncbi:MAG: MBL fold metallo-hydrolase, partial [Polaromonas sp.]
RAIDVFVALFGRPIDNDHLLGLATGESLAHINYLLARGEAKCEIGADGVRRYRMK